MTRPINPSRAISANYCQPWSEEDKEALRGYVRWMTRAEIGRALGRTPLSVQGQCKKLGLRLIRDDLGMRRHYEKPHVEGRKAAEENDTRFVRALALAIYRGEHLPGASNA